MLKQELEAQLKLINGVAFLAVEVDLTPPAIKDLAFDLGQGKEIVFWYLVTQKGESLWSVVTFPKHWLQNDQ